ncbi:DUF6624 domain-containing protein [Sulfidibacter corallicola]|uniref:Uncharacterized protein n=1 Tax=Sulfidibacter corallicola TaxID=2818388 RepID=A0A8A4TQT9_SULCO|nr:DUF6624 domain-containing protein [Sulfidibacter corallicola]QTD52339.1 hypothetical protein J3U87_07675 [Sulfidibacter corallicola]
MLKPLSFSMALLWCSSHLFGQSYHDLTQKAEAKFKEKAYALSVDYYFQAFDIDPPNSGEAFDYYRAARASALNRDPEQAIEFLATAVRMGWTDDAHMRKDATLRSLHTHWRWKNLVAQAVENQQMYQSQFNAQLVDELKSIRTADQENRVQLDATIKKHGSNSPEARELRAKIQATDKVNLAKVEKIIAEHGYPGKSMVGYQQTTAFLVIQHAPLEVQEKYLPLLSAAAESGELPKSSMALLVDRVLARTGKKQRYGSQVVRQPDGTYQLHPIEDEANVNIRRLKMGLEPLEQYVAKWGIEYRPTIRNH